MQNQNKKYDVIIIGGGIIGANIAYLLAKYQLKILVLEKNPYLADETSHGNSGLIHGGFDPEPNKREAKLNVLGNHLWIQSIFKNVDFPRIKVDSVIIAFSKEELPHLDLLYKRGLTNGVKKEDLKIIDQKTLLKNHPDLNPMALGALVCTSSWAIDPHKASLALFGSAALNGVTIHNNSKVTQIKQEGKFWKVVVNDKTIYETNNIINASGIYGDEVANLANQGPFKLETRRGQYRVLSRSQAKYVKAAYFMVPTIHGKGVIVAPLLDGRILVGPTSEKNIPKDETRVVTQKMWDLIGKIGHQIIPALDMDKTEATFAGSRPIEPISNDFVIDYGHDKSFINVIGTKSPALASAPAIALEVENLLKGNGTKLVLKKDFEPKYKSVY